MLLSDWNKAHDLRHRLTIHDQSPGCLHLTVRRSAQSVEKHWEIQLLHRLPPLRGGQRYKLTFEASGTFSVGFRLNLTMPKPPWTMLERGQLVELGNLRRRYEVFYAPPRDLDDVQLQLDLALEGAEGTIDLSDLRWVSAGDRPKVPEQSYMICATPRSGSSWLASVLWNTEATGRPAESFLHYYARSAGKIGAEAGTQDWALPRDDYVARVIDLGMTANGVFGTKMMLGYLATTANWLGEPIGLGAAQFDDVFQYYFPGLRYLHLYRRDKVDQAVSMYIAAHTDRWRASGGEGEPAPPYDDVRINREYDLLMREDAEWRERLEGVPGFVGSVAYEDLRADFDARIGTILERLDLKPTAAPRAGMTSVKRQSSPVKAAYAARFRADRGLPDAESPKKSGETGRRKTLRQLFKTRSSAQRNDT